jgi:hypothetical protein
MDLPGKANVFKDREAEGHKYQYQPVLLIHPLSRRDGDIIVTDGKVSFKEKSPSIHTRLSGIPL